MQERYIATADLGSSKIAIGVAKITGEDVEVVYYKETPSDGIRNSRIYNPTRAAETLRTAVESAEKELGLKIMQIIVGLPRWDVQQDSGTAVIDRSDPKSCITDDEISLLKDNALDLYPMDNDNLEIYGAVAQSFSTEDMIQAPEYDIIGSTASRLEGNFKIFVGQKKALDDIDTMLGKLDIACARKLFLPHSTAKAVLKTEERDNGVALIEMGAGVTSLCIYKGGILRHYSSIPFGGSSITGDIKYECGFRSELAENIKLAFGACIPEKLQAMGDKIIQINDEENGTYERLPVKYLSEIITCRVREIIDALLFQIQESGYADRLRNGIVLTGGGAELANMANLIKEMSGYNVRIGYPRHGQFIAEGCQEIKRTSAVATVGMIMASKAFSGLSCTIGIVEAAKISEEARNETAEYKDTVFQQTKDEELISGPRTKNKKSGEKSGILPKWLNKQKKAISNKIDGTIGVLFDEMGNQQN